MDIAGHYGLIGLRERTRLAKGKFDVTSVPREGTTLTISLPLDEFGGEE
jgi:signal transduction histidine kinase